MKSIETLTGTIEADKKGEAPTFFEAKIYEHEWKGQSVTLREAADNQGAFLNDEMKESVLLEMNEQYDIKRAGKADQIYLYQGERKLWQQTGANFYEGKYGHPEIEMWPVQALPQYEVEGRIFEDALSRTEIGFQEQAKRDRQYMRQQFRAIDAEESQHESTRRAVENENHDFAEMIDRDAEYLEPVELQDKGESYEARYRAFTERTRENVERPQEQEQTRKR